MVLHNPMAKSGGRTVGGEKSGSTARCVTVRERYTRTGEPFVSRPLRCAKRETQDLPVLVTRGARARGARARGPRPEARGARARGPRSEVRDCGVSARSQPKVCVTREVANKYSRESILYLS